MNELRQRHGCVTFWLWLVLLTNLGSSLFYLVAMFDMNSSNISLGYGLLAIVGLVAVLGAILLMRWNKLGFYVLLVSSLVALFVNIGLLGLPSVTVLSSLVGVFIWWAILQIRKNGISAWKLMDSGWDYKHCRHLYQFFGGMIAFLLILMIIAVSNNRTNEYYDDIIDDTEYIEGDSVVDEIAPIKDEVVWKVYEDETKSVSIEAPDDFRRVKFNDDQLMALCCTDYDPAVCIVQETVSSLNAVGVRTTEEYTQLILKMLQNSGGSNYKKISQTLRHGDSSPYITEYELTMGGYHFYYKMVAKKTQKYFYYCQVYCLNTHKDKLVDQIEHIVESFKVFK